MKTFFTVMFGFLLAFLVGCSDYTTGAIFENEIYIKSDVINQEVSSEVSADFFALLIPQLDKENGNFPGQQIPNDTYQFLIDHPGQFPATDDFVDQKINFINTEINYQHLSKSLENYTTTLYNDSGYVVDLKEEFIPKIKSYITHLSVVNENEEVYEVVYPGILKGVLLEDYLEFVGIPTIQSSFENFGGGNTNVIVVIASYLK